MRVSGVPYEVQHYTTEEVIELCAQIAEVPGMTPKDIARAIRNIQVECLWKDGTVHLKTRKREFLLSDIIDNSKKNI
jgi:hypothetical protein